MGKLPEDYQLMKAAEWLGHKKTEAPFIPLWWLLKAIDYMNAEAEGQKSLEDHNSRKTR